MIHCSVSSLAHNSLQLVSYIVTFSLFNTVLGTCKQSSFIQMDFGMLLLNNISWMVLLNICVYS